MNNSPKNTGRNNSKNQQADQYFSRNDFLKLSAGTALTLATPAILQAKPGGLETGDTILVILQLAGGNDGLNTVVPYSNDYYYKARPRLAINKNKCLPLNSDLGLHPALKGFKQLYDNNQLAIVQGVGYPDPNRSHFRSQDIWQTASDSKEIQTTGWLGRWFEQGCKDCGADIAVAFGKKAPREFASRYPKGITLQASRIKKGFRKRGDGDISFEESTSLADLLDDREGGSVGAPSGGLSGMPVLEYLETAFEDTDAANKRVQMALQKATTASGVKYPGSKLSRDFAIVARLIHGGLPGRVYHLNAGGFDTHANQKNAHIRLLSDLGDSMAAFFADLKRRGQHSKVTVLVWSEFGRRVRENGSAGTDHGVAGPVFVIGNVKGGLYGRYPSLAPAQLHKGDLVHTVDYRSVYATLAEKILGIAPHKILGRNFKNINFL